jgi:hypothetical protein
MLPSGPQPSNKLGRKGCIYPLVGILEGKKGKRERNKGKKNGRKELDLWQFPVC